MNPVTQYRRTHNLILALLLLLTAAAWVVTIRQAVHMAATPLGSGLFLGTWVTMMVAMMFPSAAPMVLTFSKIQASRQQRGQFFVPTWVFTAGYLTVWTGFGVLALGVNVGLEAAGVLPTGSAVTGALLIAAGLYQFSPLKHACLSRCRTPLAFILGAWRDGYLGAFRMGLEHGFYCLGCCWLLFVILFPLGLMNLGAMATVALLILAEKTLPAGPWVSRVAGLGLIAWGLVIVFMPGQAPAM